jgi:acetylornithine/succinyldiaminopimelate/putrescine aminotransferase
LTNRQLFLQYQAQTSDNPLLIEIEKAQGVWMYGPNQEKYLDLISGISVSNLGHCHPAVVEAVNAQTKTFMHLMVYGEFVYNPTTRLAKLLVDNLPTSLNNVYFTNSGSEAVEGAIKLAKRYTGRSEIISFTNAYHGSSTGALSIMGSEFFKSNYRPLMPGNRNIEYNNFSDLQLITNDTAAVIAEPVQAEAGIIAPLSGFLEHLSARCKEVGALLIYDEIQTGMGRTGKLFAFEHTAVVPDILLLAKGFGGGLPIGALIASHELMSVFTHNPFLGHITTFGGNAVCAAAAEATLKVLLESNLIASIEQKGKLFDHHFKEYKKLTSYHRVGFLIALGFDHFDINKKIIDQCIKDGLITDWFLFNSASMRICPPLIITEEEINYACDIIKNAINLHLV